MCLSLIDRMLTWLLARRYRGWEEKEFWEEYSDIYKNLEKGYIYARLARATKELLEPREGDIWLDAGCGPLKMSQLIWEKSNKKIAKIVGADLVLKTAKERKINLNSDFPLELVQLDLSRPLPFKRNSFDGIVAGLVLPYLPGYDRGGKESLKRTLEELYRILKPGGHLVWSGPKKEVFFEWVFLVSIPSMLNFYEYIRNKDFTRILQAVRLLSHGLEIQRKGKEGIYVFLSIKEAEELMKEVGFKNITHSRSFAQQVDIYRAYK